ncbi:hypothetical protein BDV33DRAFT_173310 [Aspergillus novoparasiticus]|uniref:Uncharacterized protein n=1 Tax=Aspergillus novoparasiticus TaxID=986946 RepID=A0A5N6ESC6_9EURO|nr:hypothetical protein BDV33DRAFT_173310 [Aspergillus novoparasiticus]
MTCIQSVIQGFPYPETNLHATMPYLSISRKLRRIFLLSFLSFFLFPSLMISRGTSVTVKFDRRSHCQE